MIVALCVLLVMYVGLILLYLFGPQEQTSLTPWPLLPIPPPDPLPTSPCQSNADCPDTHICFGTTCVPKLLRGGQCDPAHGQWISFSKLQVPFAICACLDDTLFTQNMFGADCNVNVGCGVHGTYDPDRDRCDCDPGYVAVGRTCQKVPAMEYPSACGPDDMLVSDVVDEFHADYLKRLGTCVRRPCSFDALTGRALPHAKHVPGWGCVCDPRYGLFGVQLEGQDKRYLSSEGFDACASVFEADPQEPLDVQLVTFFYLKEPVSFIIWDNIPLRPPFSGRRLMIRQTPWRYDYAQHFFKETPSFRVRTRRAAYNDLWFSFETMELVRYKDDFKPDWCGKQYRDLSEMVRAYKMLYQHPVCFVGEQDLQADPMYRGRIVVNPIHVTYKEFPHLPRFHAFVLKYEAAVGLRRWTLDLGYPAEHLPLDAPDYGNQGAP